MKKIVAILLAAMMAVSATACSSSGGTSSASQSSSESASSDGSSSVAESSSEASSETSSTDTSSTIIRMVTDTGGVQDQSFNQSAWEGLQKLKTDKGTDVGYLESKQESDYATNLDKVVDDGANLVWGIGFAMADAITTAAQKNPDIHYAIIDSSYGDATPANVTGVMFRAQEPSFMVGYIAAKTTKTDKVGFVGGMKSDIISQFENGYKAGVDYGAKELGKTITVDVQYAESFTDAAKGKAIANKMYSGGCDIVYHAAGGVGVGVIDAAKEANKLVIGVDRDQSDQAPDNMLTSALKNVNAAVENLSVDFMSGKEIGSQTFVYGLTEGAVGIPEEHKLMGDDTYNAALAVGEKIKSGEIVPPATDAEYAKFGK